MIKQRKLPQRRCTGCREMLDKNSLIRIVCSRSDDGQGDTFAIDLTGKANGRGAYICKASDCLEKAMKSKGLERSFKAKIPANIYERIRNELGAQNHE